MTSHGRPIHFVTHPNEQFGIFNMVGTELENHFSKFSDLKTLEDGDRVVVDNDTVTINFPAAGRRYTFTHSGGPFTLRTLLGLVQLTGQKAWEEAIGDSDVLGTYAITSPDGLELRGESDVYVSVQH